MSFFKSPEQKAAEAEAASPANQARGAYQRGDLILQIALDLADHQGRVHTLATLSPRGPGARSTTETADVNEVLTAVCLEGWDLINGTVVFVPTTQESRDKFMASGQQVAISGRTVGYYLFRRREPS